MPVKIFVVNLLLVAAVGCTDKSKSSSTEQLTAAQLADRGKTIYNLNCIACHNVDPSKEGTAGPAIYGSSLELIEARVLKAQYPAGYKPKRESKLMPPLPHLEKEISGIHAFLNATSK